MKQIDIFTERKSIKMLWLSDGYKMFPASSLRPDMSFCESCDRITPKEKMLDEFFCSKECQDKRLGLYTEEENQKVEEKLQYTKKGLLDIVIGDICIVTKDTLKWFTSGEDLKEGQELRVIGDYTTLGEGSGIRLKDKNNNEYRLPMPFGRLIKVISIT